MLLVLGCDMDLLHRSIQCQVKYVACFGQCLGMDLLSIPAWEFKILIVTQKLGQFRLRNAWRSDNMTGQGPSWSQQGK